MIDYELANTFVGQFEYLGENTKKYKTFSIPIEKEVPNIDKVVMKVLSLNIVSAKFMTSSLSNLVDNVAEGICKIKCKDCDRFLEHESVKDNLIKYNAYLAIKVIQSSLMKNCKSHSRIH